MIMLSTQRVFSNLECSTEIPWRWPQYVALAEALGLVDLSSVIILGIIRGFNTDSSQEFQSINKNICTIIIYFMDFYFG